MMVRAMLTGKQRYWQAMTRARIVSDRELREYMAGQRYWLECGADRERDYLINELDRAFEAGVSHGWTSNHNQEEIS